MNILQPLLGGALIGLSATIMLGFLGRITGISGIVAGSLFSPKKDELWRYAFILGLILGGVILLKTHPQYFSYELSDHPLKVILAGLIVGFGTRLGSGCTSGHGVCGLARLSKRSLVATMTFMISGIITVLIMRWLS